MTEKNVPELVESGSAVSIAGLIHRVLLPDVAGPHPTAVMLHERLGPVKHIFDLGQRMADEGFASFVPD